MKRLLGAVAVWVSCAVSAVASGSGTPIRTGAWVVRDAISTPEGIAQICREAAAARLDTLPVQVRGRGDAYYRSRLAPRAEVLASAPEGFDPLREVLGCAGEARVLAWMNVFFVWGGDTAPRDAAHPARSRGEWILRDDEGRPVSEYSPADRALGWIEGIYVDPAAPEYRSYFGDLVREVAAEYGVSGVHLDFVRYPGLAYGYGGALGRLFEDTWGFDPRWIPEGLRSPNLKAWAAGTMAPEDRVLATAALLWAGLRAGQVTSLVRAARQALDSVRPGLELSVAVVPDAGPAYLEKGQDWRTWAALGLADALYPMAYFGGPERVSGQLASVARLARRGAPGVRLWAGLGGYRKDVAAVAAEAEAARKLGYQGVCLFDAGTLIRKSPGLGAYVQAVEGPCGEESAQRVGAQPLPATHGGRRLATIFERASGESAPAEALDARWEEFERSRTAEIPAALARARTGSRKAPAWVDLNGVFRYAYPGSAKEGEEAERECGRARRRLVAGERMEKVAREMSQGGTKSLGGVLRRHYLASENEQDAVLARLEPGEISPVVQAENGCWVYRVSAKGGGKPAPADALPWPARRIQFRQALREEMGRAGRQPLPESASVKPGSGG